MQDREALSLICELFQVMTERTLRGREDPRRLMVEFSAGVTRAFRDIADLMTSDESADPDLTEIIERFASGKPISVHDVLLAFPLVVENALTTGNTALRQQLSEVWSEIASQMVEGGFSVLGRPPVASRA